MRVLKALFTCIILSTTVYLSGCGGDDEDFEAEVAEITGCSTFKYNDINFTLPSGRCEEGATVDYDVTENGESFKFKIICDGVCIDHVETRE